MCLDSFLCAQPRTRDMTCSSMAHLQLRQAPVPICRQTMRVTTNVPTLLLGSDGGAACAMAGACSWAKLSIPCMSDPRT